MEQTRANQARRRTRGAWTRVIALIVAGVCIGVGALVAVTRAAVAEPRVDYTIEGGTLNVDGETAVELSGSGFQSIQGGFGGIYVLFGWVSDPTGGSWRPSQGGITGENYQYAFDDESNPAGYQVFVSFPGSSTEYAANGGEIAADGTWHATIKIPGATFTSYDRQQNETPVDCTTEQCGIITIGAHGVKNPNNESFTALTFETAAAAVPKATQAAADAPATTAADAVTAAPQESQAPAAPTTAAAAVAPVATADIQNQDSSGPMLLSTVLLIIGALIGGVALVVLAAGTGGYLAAKSLLLGISPAALQREIGRRQRRADRVRHREDMKRAKAKHRAYKRLQKQEDRADAAALEAGAALGSPSSTRESEVGGAPVLQRPRPTLDGQKSEDTALTTEFEPVATSEPGGAGTPVASGRANGGGLKEFFEHVERVDR